MIRAARSGLGNLDRIGEESSRACPRSPIIGKEPRQAACVQSMASTNELAEKTHLVREGAQQRGL